MESWEHYKTSFSAPDQKYLIQNQVSYLYYLFELWNIPIEAMFAWRFCLFRSPQVFKIKFYFFSCKNNMKFPPFLCRLLIGQSEKISINMFQCKISTTSEFAHQIDFHSWNNQSTNWENFQIWKCDCNLEWYSDHL